MNPLSNIVEQTYRNYSQKAVLKLVADLGSNPGEIAEAFGLPANVEYVLKRLLGALLAREPDLKFSAYLALNLLKKHFQGAKVEPLFKYFTELSNYKKENVGKTSQIEGYVVGKILAFKALSSVFAGHLPAWTHLSELIPAFPAFQEQFIEALADLSTKKTTKSHFYKIVPTTKSGFVLFKILEARLKKTKLELNSAAVSDVLTEVVASYPKRSICLDYLGPELKNFIEKPVDFLDEQFSKIFEENQAVETRRLSYLLHILAGHLKNLTLTADNIWENISIKALGGWILQLKVKNKVVRSIAESVTINFAEDSNLAYTLLLTLHEKGLYLQNINHKHPLSNLYKIVDPQQYCQYLITLIENQTEELQEENKKSYFSELQYFISNRHQEINIDLLCKSITILLIKFHSNKNENTLKALNTVLNSVLSHNSKKGKSLQKRPSIILSKLNLQNFSLGEQSDEVKSAIKKIRALFKASEQQTNDLAISFCNFLLAVGFYLLIYPEEIEIFSDLQMVQKDIFSFYLKQEGLQPKKKRKTEQQDKTKPIHVLIQIFISLLTKSSQFLRNTINILFQDICPYVDKTDLSVLLDVITKSDTEFIEETKEE